MEEKFREDVKEMCNLSQGIKEAGRATRRNGNWKNERNDKYRKRKTACR